MKKIPKKLKGQGLHVYCNKCKRQVTSKCGTTGSPRVNCEFKEHHKFKLVVHKTGLNRKFTKVSSAETVEAAHEELLKFKKTLSLSGEIISNDSFTLATGIKEYLQKLNCEGAYKRKSKPVTTDHIQDCVRTLEAFVLTLRSHRIEPNTLSLSALQERHTDLYLIALDNKKYSQSTYSKHIRIMRAFLSFLIKKQLYKGRNYFSDVRLSKIASSPETISDEDFEKVLDTITPDNSAGSRGDGRKIDYYRPWLKTALRVARLTGLRKEELANLKFSDIILEDDIPLVIQVRNLKVERLKGVEGISKAIPVLPELVAILKEISESSDVVSEYLIDERMNRKYLMDFISRAFTHFFTIRFPERKPIRFKALRKAFITEVVAQYGSQAYTLTGQSGMKLISDHYYDPVVGAKKFAKMLQGSKRK